MHSISTSASKNDKAWKVFVSSIYVPVLCLLCFCTISCKKFLSTNAQNKSFIETTADLDELLVGEAYLPAFSLSKNIFVMDDDTEMGKPETSVRVVMNDAGYHYWMPNPRLEIDQALNVKIDDNTDLSFNKLYKLIANINSIIYNVTLLEDKGEPISALNRIAGEAHFLRAYYYFTLVNLYGKPYKPATAATDFGVPLKTEPEIKDQFATRSTTKQVYDQIINDLLLAEKKLSGANVASGIRANQAAAQSLLSRVYLFMENYEKALYWSNEVIASNDYQLSNLNQHNASSNFLVRTSSEVVFTMQRASFQWDMFLTTDYPANGYYLVSGDLMATYEPADLRRQVFFQQNSRGQWKLAKIRANNFQGTTEDLSDMFLLRLAELYLNKAEALAALNRFEEARNTMQELRKRRFNPTDLTIISADGAALMNIIREERRRELCFESHRWFDLRRYAVNTKYPFSKSIRHRSYIFSGSEYIENGYYELAPYDLDQAAYIIPIANGEIEFNQGHLTNEVRPARSLKQ